MSKREGLFKKPDQLIALLSLLVSVFGVVIAFIAFVQGWTPELFSRNTRFSCTLQSDTQNGGKVWTVMYRNENGVKPWLKMVNSFGDSWDTRVRCDEVAKRLENFRQDGLIGLSYRSDPKKPNQFVICVKTKLDRDNCNLLLTLKPNVDGYDALRQMTMALNTGTTVDQGSGVATHPTVNSPFVSFEDQLAAEDRQARAKAN